MGDQRGIWCGIIHTIWNLGTINSSFRILIINHWDTYKSLIEQYLSGGYKNSKCEWLKWTRKQIVQDCNRLIPPRMSYDIYHPPTIEFSKLSDYNKHHWHTGRTNIRHSHIYCTHRSREKINKKKAIKWASNSFFGSYKASQHCFNKEYHFPCHTC